MRLVLRKANNKNHLLINITIYEQKKSQQANHQAFKQILLLKRVIKRVNY